MLFASSCTKKNEAKQNGVDDSVQLQNDSIQHPIGDAIASDFPGCLREPKLAALIPCAIQELARDGDLEQKKQDCLDSLDKDRITSVLRADPIFHPIYLPNLLDENDVFNEQYRVSVIAEGDSQEVFKKFSDYKVEIKKEYQGWRVSIPGWLDSVEAERIAVEFSRIAGVGVDSKNKARGAIALGVCLSAQDSAKLARAANSNGIPLKFALISYSRTDIDDLLAVEGEEE